MSTELQNRLRILPTLAALASAALAVIVGGTVLIGWAFDITALKSILPGWVSVKPNTALAFVLTGIALLFHSSPPLTLSRPLATFLSRLGQLCGWLAGLIGLLTLCEYVFGWNPGFDQWLFPEPAGTVGTSHPGRMAPDAALCFVLLAAGLEIARRPRKTTGMFVASAILGSLVTTVALVEILSYFTPALRTYGWGGLTMMALPTATLFGVLGAALALNAWQESLPKSNLPAKPVEGPTSRPMLAFLLVFLLLASGILATGIFYYRSYERHYQVEVERQLSAIADLKVSELVQWRKERLGDAEILFKNTYVTALVRRFLEKPEAADARQQLQMWLGKSKTHYESDQVRLLDTQGVNRLTLPAKATPVSSAIVQGALETLRSGQVMFQDFYRNEHDQDIYLATMIPILDETDGHRPLGVIVLRMDPDIYLYPFIKRWPTPSATAETLLVRREGNDALFLNDLRFRTNTALNLRVPLDRVNMPAVQALLGREGVFEGVDYRGVPVVSALRTVPDSPWHMVARMDSAEVYAPLRAQLWQVVVMIGILLFGAGACVVLVWRQQRVRFYRDRAETTDLMRASELRYRRLFESAKDGILILDAETGMVVDVNPFMVEMLGYSREACLGKKVWELGFLKDLLANQTNFTELQQKEYIRYEDMALESHDGKRHEVEFVSNVYWVNHHKVIQCNIRDISDRKRAEQALALQARIATIFTTVPDEEMFNEVLKVILDVMHSPFGVFGFIDEAGALVVPTMTRQIWDKCQVPDKTFVFPRATWGDSSWPRAIREKKANYSNEVSTKSPAGHVTVTRHINVPILFQDEVIGVFEVANKETDYTKADVATLEAIAEQIAPLLSARLLRERAERNQRLAADALRLLNRPNNLNVLVEELVQLIKKSTCYDAVGLRIRQGEDFPYYVQNGFPDAFVKEENFLCAKGKDAAILRNGDGKPMLECTCGVVLSGRADPKMPCFTEGGSFWTNHSSELLALAPEADPRTNPRNRCIHDGYESVALIPLRSGDEIIGLLQLNDRRRGRFTPEMIRFFEGLANSIGIALKRRQDYEALRATAREWQTTFDVVSSAVWLLDRDQRIMRANRATEKVVGQAPDKVLGRSCCEVVHGTPQPPPGCPILRMRKSLRRESTELAVGQGWVEVTVDPILDKAGRYAGAVHIVTDITERKRAEAALETSEKRFRDIAGNAQEWIWEVDAEGKYTYASDVVKTILGYTPEEILQKHFYDSFHPDDREAIKAAALAAFASKQPFRELINRNVHKNGQTVWLVTSGLPLLDEKGNLLGYRGVDTDITERKRTEAAILTLNVELEQRVAERTAELQAANKELDAFCHSVSHDLRAPLRGISGFAGMLTEDYAPRLDDEGCRLLGTIRGEAKRMSQMIDDLLAFSKLGRQSMESVETDMTALAQTAFNECAAQAPGRNLQFKLQPLPSAQGDPNLLSHVWSNLISNAVKYTRNTPVAEIEITGRADDKDGVVYCVKDNGAGFDMKYAQKLFSVFHRLHTDAAFEGTGIGLALVQHVVQRHGGRIWAEAEVNKGATFYFTLPPPRKEESYQNESD